MRHPFVMKPERKRLLYKTSTLVGSVFVLLPNGVAMYWGNLSVYASSYLVVCLQSTDGIEAPWVISFFVLFWTLAIMAYNTVRNCIGKRWVAVLGCLFTELGILASYFSVQTSFILLNITIAVLAGIGTGFLHAHLLRLLVDWANNDVACLLSTMQGSFHWGAVIINQMVTLYLNPSNVTPNVMIGSSTYFTQKSILDNVPSLFLVLGGFSVACHFIGFSLLRDNVFDKSNQSGGENQVQVSSLNGEYKVDNTSTRNDVTTSKATLDRSTPCKGGCYDSQSQNQNLSSSISQEEGYTPKEVLKSPTFYALWVTFLFAEYPFLLLGNYYKSFGQIWIQDDYFLTNLGTSLAFINIWMRIVWGAIMDKIGVWKCLSFQIFLVVLMTIWLFFTAVLNKWFYFVLTNMLGALAGALFSSISIAAVAIFGKKHFSTNFGLLRSPALFLSIVCPFISEAILKHFGWFYIFSSAGFVNTISLILMLFFIPQF